MTPNWRYWYLAGASLLTMGGVSSSLRDCALAQITKDSTLGAESSVVKPNVDIKGVPSDRIDGGATRGTNLFHSFEQFNVNAERGAYFTNPAGIENILSRVTGASRSNIFGRLGVLGSANLFLINPKGVIFGPNASLDVSGSFVTTSANAIGFGNQGSFSASEPNVPPLLTVNPSAFLFNQVAGPITNQSVTGLQVPQGRSLLLLGGDVTLDGGKLFAPSGRVELGGLAESGTVGLNVDGNNLNLSFPDGVASADVSLTKAVVDITPKNRDVDARGGGTIAINAGNISIADNSSLFADARITDESAGNILVQANGNVYIAKDSGLSSKTFIAKGKAGSILVQADNNVSIEDSSQILSSSFEAPSEEGDAGSVSVQADNGDVFIINESSLSSEALGGQGDAGRVSVRADNGDVFVNKSSISSNTDRDPGAAGNGAAGDIKVSASSIRLDNKAALRSETTAGQGNIILRSGDLVLRRGSNITTDATGTAPGGNINIDTDVIIALKNSDITARAVEGQGGNIQINTQGLILSPDSQIIASSERGIDGVVEINTLVTDPSQGLATLPAELGEASRLLIATGCAALGENEFTVTGRGGLPPNPTETLSGDTVWTDLRPTTQQTENRPLSEEAIQPTISTSEQLVEAQEWAINDKGEVVLTAHAPNVRPNIPWLTPATCHSSTFYKQPLALGKR